MLEDLAALCRPEGNARVRENAHTALTAVLNAVRSGCITREVLRLHATLAIPSSWQVYPHLRTPVVLVHSPSWRILVRMLSCR
jgi:hypothetical protein